MLDVAWSSSASIAEIRNTHTMLTRWFLDNPRSYPTIGPLCTVCITICLMAVESSQTNPGISRKAPCIFSVVQPMHTYQMHSLDDSNIVEVSKVRSFIYSPAGIGMYHVIRAMSPLDYDWPPRCSFVGLHGQVDQPGANERSEASDSHLIPVGLDTSY